MSEPRRWLGSRRPAAPPEVLAAVRAALGDGDAPGELADVLAEAGRRRLEAARRSPGRDRDAAYELLAADALITYACEAALEAEDADAILARIAEVGAAP